MQPQLIKLEFNPELTPKPTLLSDKLPLNDTKDATKLFFIPIRPIRNKRRKLARNKHGRLGLALRIDSLDNEEFSRS